MIRCLGRKEAQEILLRCWIPVTCSPLMVKNRIKGKRMVSALIWWRIFINIRFDCCFHLELPVCASKGSVCADWSDCFAHPAWKSSSVAYMSPPAPYVLFAVHHDRPVQRVLTVFQYESRVSSHEICAGVPTPCWPYFRSVIRFLRFGLVCRSLPIQKCYISNTVGFQTSSQHVGSNGGVQRLGLYPVFFYPWVWTGTDVSITCLDCMLFKYRSNFLKTPVNIVRTLKNMW